MNPMTTMERTAKNIEAQRRALDDVCTRVSPPVARVLKAWAAGGTEGDPFVFWDKENAFLWWISTEDPKGGVSGSVLKIAPEKGKKPVGWKVRDKGTTDRGVHWMRIRSQAVYREENPMEFLGNMETPENPSSALSVPSLVLVATSTEGLVEKLQRRFARAFLSNQAIADDLDVALALTPEPCLA